MLADDLKDKLTPEQAAKLERLQTRITDLVKMINTWLRAISVDINSIRDHFAPVSISTVITKSVESVQNQAIRKDIDLNVNVQEPLQQVLGDEGTLVEAVVNIAGNAVKYTRVGGWVCIEATERGESILISVTDNGVGIADEDIPNLFEDFYIGKSTTDGERRSGVGLAITRRIIEAHNGKITVESKLGEGSTFVIHLPVIKNSDF